MGSRYNGLFAFDGIKRALKHFVGHRPREEDQKVGAADLPAHAGLFGIYLCPAVVFLTYIFVLAFHALIPAYYQNAHISFLSNGVKAVSVIITS